MGGSGHDHDLSMPRVRLFAQVRNIPRDVTVTGDHLYSISQGCSGGCYWPMPVVPVDMKTHCDVPPGKSPHSVP